MAKKLQRRKTRHQSITPKNPTSQSIMELNKPKEIVSPDDKIFSKASSAITEAERYRYVKGDLKRSLIVGAAMFALMLILYFCDSLIIQLTPFD